MQCNLEPANIMDVPVPDDDWKFIHLVETHDGGKGENASMLKFSHMLL